MQLRSKITKLDVEMFTSPGTRLFWG